MIEIAAAGTPTPSRRRLRIVIEIAVGTTTPRWGLEGGRDVCGNIVSAVFVGGGGDAMIIIIIHHVGKYVLE